jgi:sugar-phosphatase
VYTHEVVGATIAHYSDSFGAEVSVIELKACALLFDLDGVLVNSIESVERAWRSWARRHDMNAATVIDAAHGRRAVDTLGVIAPQLDVATELRALTDDEASDASGLYPIAGVAALLHALPRRRWAVVTSGVRRVALFRLKTGGIPIPDVLISAEDVEHGKPNPEGYLRAAELLGVAPEHCVVVEDAPAGIQAAVAAGMRAIGVLGTYPREALSEAAAIVDSFGSVNVRVSADAITLAMN